MKAVYFNGKTDDLTDCFKVRYEVFEIEQHVSHELEFDGMDQNCIHVLVYSSDNQPVATGRMFEKAVGVWKIGRVATMKNCRKKGYGEVVMKMLIDKAKEMGGREIILGAQLTAVEFYRRLGFEAYGEIFLDADIDHQHMKLKLHN